MRERLLRLSWLQAPPTLSFLAQSTSLRDGRSIIFLNWSWPLPVHPLGSRPTCMASMQQVSRSLFLMLTQMAGWESRRFTTSTWPDPAAYMRGTQPRQFRAFTSTPSSRHRRTVSRSPRSAAPQIPAVFSGPASVSVSVLTESDLLSPAAISLPPSHSTSDQLTVQPALRRQSELGGCQGKIDNRNTTLLNSI